MNIKTTSALLCLFVLSSGIALAKSSGMFDYKNFNLEINKIYKEKELAFRPKDNDRHPYKNLYDKYINTFYIVPKFNPNPYFSLQISDSFVHPDYGMHDFVFSKGLKAFAIFNGNQTDKNSFKSYSRVKKIRISKLYAKYRGFETDDGQYTRKYTKLEFLNSEEYNLKDKLGLQIIKLSPIKPIDRETFNEECLFIIIEIIEVFPGKISNEICISGLNYLTFDNTWKSHKAPPIFRDPENVAKINALIDSMD